MKCHVSDKTQGWDTFSETAHAQLAVPLEKASWERLTVGLKTRKILSLLFFKQVAIVKEKEVMVVVS